MRRATRATLLILAGLLVSQQGLLAGGLNTNRAGYIGGTVNIPQGAEGYLNTADETQVKCLGTRGESLNIP
jgi:hypothetical protein